MGEVREHNLIHIFMWASPGYGFSIKRTECDIRTVEQHFCRRHCAPRFELNLITRFRQIPPNRKAHPSRRENAHATPRWIFELCYASPRKCSPFSSIYFFKSELKSKKLRASRFEPPTEQRLSMIHDLTLFISRSFDWSDYDVRIYVLGPTYFSFECSCCRS